MNWRAPASPALSKPFDVAVIGGGVNGTGVARDCAMRGMRVLLLEKNDFSSGTSSASSGMIHGGLRYLGFDRNTTRITSEDSGYIQRIAPHLIFRIPWLNPVFKGEPYGMELWEIVMKAYDSFRDLKGGKEHTRLTREQALALEPGLNPKLLGAVTWDEWGIDVPRLCFANALAARELGGFILNHAEVLDFRRDGQGAVTGVRVRHGLSGEVFDIEAKITVNCAGPWVPRVARMAGVEVRLRLGKGVHVVYDRRISNVSVTARAIDGRGVFLAPHENVSWIGTTDDDYYGELDNLSATQDEVEYLVEGMSRVFPRIREYKRSRVMVGLRPTLYAWGKYEDDLSRRYEVIDHEERDNVAGFVTLAGGKLAAYRLMAEDTTDLVAAKLAVSAACRTHIEPLPGARGHADTPRIAEKARISLFTAARAAYRHGDRTEEVLSSIADNPRWSRSVCGCEQVTEAEVRYCVQRELAGTLSDLWYRTRLGMGPCHGMACAPRAAQILVDEQMLEPPEGHEEVARFLEFRWRDKYPVADGLEMAQEELARGIFIGAYGYDAFREDDGH